MSHLTCARCGSSLHCLHSHTSAPPWCPVCGADFQAAREVTVRRPIPPIPEPSTDVVPLTVAAPIRAAAARAAAARVAGTPRTTVPLPAGVPGDVTALGDPEQVYATDALQHQGLHRLAQGVIALLMVALLAIAGFHFYVAEHPIPAYRLSPGVARGVGIGVGMVSLVLAVASIVFTSTTWGRSLRGPRTYLVYPHLIVELRPGWHRVIPLEQIGADERIILSRVYRFPVEGARALAFDDTVHDAAALAATIKERAAQRRRRVDFGDETKLAEMRSATPGPSVLALAVHERAGNVYRITLLADRLLFQCLGAAVLSDVAPSPTPGTMGLTGALIGGFNTWAHAAARQKTLAELRRLEAADGPTLVQYALEKEGSFVAELPDVRELRLEPLSTVVRFFSSPPGVEQVCALGIEHARQGRLTLALLSRDEVMTVVGPWAEVFGEVLTIAIAWSHSRCAFIATPQPEPSLG